MKSLSQCVEDRWKSVCTHVGHSVVFIDNPSAECLHWHGGLSLLVEAGATDVKEFSPFESARENQKKAVFIVSSLLFDETADVIQDIIQASCFQYVIVITTASPLLHLYAKTGALEGGDSAIFEQFEEKLLEWMGNMNYTAEVFHVALCVASPVPSVFLTPSFNSLFPLLQSDVKRIELQYNSHRSSKGDRVTFDSLGELDVNCLPKELKLSYKSLASEINELLAQLRVREEVYCLGHTSRMIALELENYPAAKNRRKSTQDTASVLFVDRTLDLVSVTGHQGETLLDRILSVLPRRQDSNDVLIDMSSLSSTNCTSDSSVVCNGCLAQVPGSNSKGIFQKITASKQKESLLEVNLQVVEAASKEKLPVKLTGKPGRVTSEKILSTVKLFRNNNVAIDNHCGLLQVAMATGLTLNHPDNGCYDNMSGVEKLLLQQLSEEDSPSGLTYITEQLKTEFKKPQSERQLGLEDILILLLHYYSLAGEDYESSTEKEEEEVKRALVEAIIQEKDNLPQIVQDLVGETVTQSIVTAIIDDLWYKLDAIAMSRSYLKNFRSLVEPASAVSPPSYTPLVKQVCNRVFDPQKPDLVDIQYKSSGFKDILKSGIGFFMNVRKPRPSDHPLLVIFVVGGVNSTEVKQIKEVISSHKADIQVLVGSTRLVTPGDILQRALCNDNLQLSQT